MTHKISIILPVFNEVGNIEPLYEGLTRVAKSVSGYSFEYIFVDDGSSDGSSDAVKNLPKGGPEVTLLTLSRNFGHQIAVTAGLDYADGEAVIIMDTDLQDPPEVIADLIGAWEKGNQVVYATRRTRQDTWFKRTTAHMFYRFINTLSDIPIPVDTGDFRLMDKRVVKELRRFHEKARFLRGLSSFVGFKQTKVLFDRRERTHGVTKYPLRKMIRLSVDAITGFSMVPLKFIGNLGFFVALLSVVGVLFAIGAKVLYPEMVVQGWTFIVISMLFMGGVQLLMLGIIGGYVGRIYDEVRDRPLYILAEVEKISSKEDL